jgi:SAM-dependent methyltransferase
MRSRKITRQKLINFLSQHATTERTLNIGSGDAYNPKEFFPNLINVDVDPGRKPDVIANVYQLPFPDAEFNHLLCLEVLEHLFEPARAIQEMARVLKPGGQLILTTRFIFPIHDAPGDYFRYTKYGLLELFKSWQVESLTPETGSLESLAVLAQRLIFQVKYRGNRWVKLILLGLVRLFLFLNKFIKREFGEIGQIKIEQDILTSGYYLIARKK